MPTLANMDIVSADLPVWFPAVLRGPKLKAQGASLGHTYETDARVFAESDWVYLQVSLVAYQIHPATLEDLDRLGPVGGRNMARWTAEGPTSLLPGEVSNCTVAVEVAHSTASTPGSDWREYRPGLYKLRSFKTRVIVTRPNDDYDFRILRFATRATRRSAPQLDHVARRFFERG